MIIGSIAAKYHGLIDRPRADIDMIVTYDAYLEWVRAHPSAKIKPLGSSKYMAVYDGTIYEFEIAWEGSSGWDLLQLCDDEYALPDVCLALKLSHRYLRNSPHFLKTRRDIQSLRAQGFSVPEVLAGEWMAKREKETYTYLHPKLNQSKKSFFNDDVPYQFDHDSIHKAVAIGRRPAYLEYAIEGKQVLSSKEKFFQVSEVTRLNGVLEESMVLAAERALIPNHSWDHERKWVIYALQKVCTSITSGYFREYAWENYDLVIKMFDELVQGYLYHSFCRGILNKTIKEFGEGNGDQ